MMFSWTKFSETLLAFASGALMTLLGTYIQAEFKESREAEVWFQSNYVTKGIDPVQNYVTLLGFYLNDANVPLDVNKEFPKHALVNLSTVLGSQIATSSIVFILNEASGLRSDPPAMLKRNRLSCGMKRISGELQALRVHLLGHEFSHKADIAHLPSETFTETFVQNVNNTMAGLESCNDANS